MDLRGKNIEEGYFNLVTVEGDSNETSGKLQDGQGSDLGNIAVGGLSFNSGDGEFELPSGTTAERPSSPSNGYVRYNTDNDEIEAYIAGGWIVVSVGDISQVFTTTVTASTDWSGSDPYVATKTVNGILSTDTPIVDIDLSGETFANVFAVEDDWALVYRVEASADDEIKLYASGEPTEDFDLIIQVNR